MRLEGVLVAAGYEDVQTHAPACDINDPGGLACTVTASRAEIRLDVVLYRVGADADGLGISVPEKATIRITARGG
jgi:hypothetical protein